MVVVKYRKNAFVGKDEYIGVYFRHRQEKMSIYAVSDGMAEHIEMGKRPRNMLEACCHGVGLLGFIRIIIKHLFLECNGFQLY